LWQKTYEETGKGLTRYKISALLPKLKQELEWLKEPYAQNLQAVAKNLSLAFDRFFKKLAKYPRFKSKYGKQSIAFPQNVKLEGDYIVLPKLGRIYCKIHREFQGEIKTVTISKNPDGKYFASLLVETGQKKPETSLSGNVIGIDLGLNHFVITSEGEKVDNPKHFHKHQKNLKRKQQKHSRKKKDSKNRNKSRVKVAKVHSKISRCREDFLHKLSRNLVDKNQVIAVENLNIKGMIKNRKLSKSISTVGWGMFCTMLKYKAEREGKVYVEVDRFFPSSKTCNVCQHKVKELPLKIREWTCPECGIVHDRDINAAKNIANEGLRILSLGTSDTAHRGNVRPKTDRKKSVGGYSQ